jgi:2-polyprenyl-3-methyl-5-hydroxy-6-metoxy-1,4-benzoquinol methylase
LQGTYAAEYARLYNGHWWWRSREAILLDLLRGLRLRPGLDVLDVGCGDGLFFPELERFGRVRGIEVDETLLSPEGPYRDRISIKLLGDPCYQGDDWQFDLITALDVIEHIEDDGSAVAEMLKMLRPGGVMVITVPAFQALWDHHDEVNLHYRRYTAASLRTVLEGQGAEVLQLRYLYRGLFPPKYLVARLNRGRTKKVEQHAIPSPTVNRLMARLCLLEDRLLRRVPIPFGTSVLAVARQKAGGS